MTDQSDKVDFHIIFRALPEREVHLCTAMQLNLADTKWKWVRTGTPGSSYWSRSRAKLDLPSFIALPFTVQEAWSLVINEYATFWVAYCKQMHISLPFAKKAEGIFSSDSNKCILNQL